MALKNQSITVCYQAWNTSTNSGQTGDSANHTLKLVQDGTEASPTNSPSQVDATDLPGLYKLVLAAADVNYNCIVLGGISSTANVVIIPMVIITESGVLPHTACTTNASLITSGTGTDQVANSSGKVLLQATQTGVTIPTVTTVTNQLTAAAVATGVWEDTTAGGDFGTAGSIGKLIVTTGLTVASVTGAVGSVTGAVGSVTGLTTATIATAVWEDTTAGGDFGTSGSIGKLIATTGAPLNLGQALNAARALDTVADTSLTLNDACHCAIASVAGQQTITGTSYVTSTPHTDTTLRTFTLNSSSTPTARN